MAASRPATSRLLIVEDDEPLRRTLSLVLRRSGFEVTEAVNGQEAIEQLRERPFFDAVLLDHSMPDMTGMEVLEWIDGGIPDLSPRVVLMSGDTRLAEGLPVGRFLAKPASATEIIKAIELVGREHRA